MTLSPSVSRAVDGPDTFDLSSHKCPTQCVPGLMCVTSCIFTTTHFTDQESGAEDTHRDLAQVPRPLCSFVPLPPRQQTSAPRCLASTLSSPIDLEVAL